MEASPALPLRKTRLVNRPGYGLGWPYFVCPTHQLAQLIEEHINLEDDQWLLRISEDMAAILKTTPESVYRRFHAVRHGQSQVTRAEWADALCLALGISLDRNTSVLTLPGNLSTAEDLIRCRAESAHIPLDDLEARRLSRNLLRITRLIIAYPNHTDRLLNLTPLDCLRSEAC